VLFLLPFPQVDTVPKVPSSYARGYGESGHRRYGFSFSEINNSQSSKEEFSRFVNREGGIPDKEMQTCLQSIAPKGTVSNRSRLRQEAVNVSLTRIAAELGVKPNSLRTCRDGAAGQGRFAGFSAKSYTCVASARSCL
jgi:hypothetical protein